MGGRLRFSLADNVADVLVEHFNGTCWMVSAVPQFGGFHSVSAVSADSPTDAWAVGDLEGGEDANGRNLVLRQCLGHPCAPGEPFDP